MRKLVAVAKMLCGMVNTSQHLYVEINQRIEYIRK